MPAIAKSQPAVGIIGLGLMGSALAERALGAGFRVIGFDIRPERCALLVRLGGQAANSTIAVATACRRIIFSLMSADQVDLVCTEISSALRRGSTIIDTSTGDPEKMMQIEGKLRLRGIHYLDAPIAGSSSEARAGNALVLVGGERPEFLDCRDIFKCFARQVFHIGPSGDGARMKLVFNLVLGLNRAVLAEALMFAEALGVSSQRALEIMREGTAYSRVMETKGGKMLAREFSPQAKLEQHLKDVRLILAAGRRTGAKLPLSALHRKLLSALVGAGHGALDNSAIIKAFE
ncbi:MAG: NAD(P)-dependent oxidoreductase [Verrucomicrobiales bacterium]